MGLKLKGAVLMAALTMWSSRQAVAIGFEQMNGGAQLSFLELTAAPAPKFVHVNSPRPMPQGEIGAHVQSGMLVRVAATPSVPSQEIGMAGILNKHLKTSLAYTLGGKRVWISGAFDRQQKAFLSVLEDGKAPAFHNVETLLTTPAQVSIGTGQYKIQVKPDLSEQLESEIVIANAAVPSDKTRITLREMLTAVSAAGHDARIGGEAYKVFYYTDITDASKKSFALITTDARNEIHVFLIPAELVPSDKIAIFKVRDNKTVGLQQVGDRLRLFDGAQ